MDPLLKILLLACIVWVFACVAWCAYVFGRIVGLL